MKLSIIYVLLTCALSLNINAAHRTFYLDSQLGSDSNTGIQPSMAWKTLEQLNKQIFEPGDKILFKAGTEYIGQFEPKGSGTKGALIIVDKYGDGSKPILHGQGQKQHTILLEGIEYWELHNIEVTNRGEKHDPGRNGIIIYAWDKGDMHDIRLNNLTVRDVNGSTIKNEGGGSAIYWHNGGDEVPTRFVGLYIENCHLYRCQRNGITGNGNSLRDKWYPSLDVVIRRNLIEQIPGDGIVPIACDGALIEYNTVRDSPDLLRIEDAAVGIWPWSCDNTLIQFNEVSGQNAKWDGQGFNSDYNSRNTIIQYNYSHDNAGGFVMICNEGNTLGEPYNIGTEGTIIRGNVSVNDGLRSYPTRPGWFSPTIHISGPAKNTTILNNTIVVYKKNLPDIDRTLLVMDNWGGPWPEQVIFDNNNVYIMNDEQEYDMVYGNSIDVRFKNNKFYGKIKNLPNYGIEEVQKPNLKKMSFPVQFPKELQNKVLERIKELTK